MVIQRIQTLYLLIAAILISVFIFMPIVEIKSIDASESLVVMPYSIIEAQGSMTANSNNYLPAILSCFVALLALITIFCYKDLNKQIRLCGICCLIIVAIIALSVLVSFNVINTINAPNYRFSFSFILPIVSILFLILACKAIKKDKKLLSSSDRIR